MDAFTVTNDLLDDGDESAVGQTWPPGTDLIGKNIFDGRWAMVIG